MSCRGIPRIHRGSITRVALSAVTAIGISLTSKQANAVIISVNRDSATATPAESEETTGTYIFTNTVTSGPNGVSPTGNVPSNSFTDLAQGVASVLLLGTPHVSSDLITVLTNGTGGTTNSTPGKYFFDDPVAEGRIRITLASPSDIGQINTYTWHNGIRSPQKYEVYGAGPLSGNAAAAVLTDQINILSNYALIATVDTTPLPAGAGPDGGQWGVSISPTSGLSLGNYQNFIFRIFDADIAAGNAHEFYSEIDIVAAVPEPGSLSMLSVGSTAIALLLRRRRRR